MIFFDLIPTSTWVWLFDNGLQVIIADIILIILLVIGYIFWELKGYWRER